MTTEQTFEAATGYETISAGDRRRFADQGWLLIRHALSDAQRADLTELVDGIHREETLAGHTRADGALHLQSCTTRDPAIARLLDHPSTFPYVWGLMGWNVYSHHSHLDINPPQRPEEPFWNWHQDGYRQNSDIDVDPRPMLSLKVCFVLSDLSEPGRGATRIIPNSHLDNTLPRPAAGEPVRDPDGAVEIIAEPGDAFVFDRRLWHSRSVNLSPVTRKLIFIGYTHRWIRPLDPMPALDGLPGLSPVQRQLLGAGTDNANYWGVRPNGWLDDEIPLRAELKRRGLLDPSIPYLR